MTELPLLSEPLIRTAVHLRQDQRTRLGQISAETGLAVAQLIRDAIDQVHGNDTPTVRGWELRIAVRKPVDATDAPPAPRARLREWFRRR